MPIYEFVCSKCRHKFSVLARSAEEGGTHPCPKCRSEETKRLFSAFAVKAKTDKDVYESILDDSKLT